MKHWRTTFERVEKFVSPVYFTDCNLRGRCGPWPAEPADHIRALSPSLPEGNLGRVQPGRGTKFPPQTGQGLGSER